MITEIAGQIINQCFSEEIDVKEYEREATEFGSNIYQLALNF